MSLTFISRTLGQHVKKHLLGFQRSFAVQKIDPLQEYALDQEKCILVDENDNTIGSASKRACHVVDSNGNIPLHRAFSVFLFNSKGEMLLQRRGNKKVTFPNVYTNACCSHPLWLGDVEENIFAAVRRRLNYELGIPLDQLIVSDFTFLTKIQYLYAGKDNWGEHEVDYIFFLQKDVHLEPNKDEITEVRYLSRSNLDEQISKLEAPLSPWFNLILQHRLRFWWDNLHQLHLCQDHSNKVHKFT